MNYRAKLEELLLKIPKGKVTTYKEIAHAMKTKGYRFVGQLLNKNPHPNTYPCYKVVQSNGQLGGFALGNKDKIRRLKEDGVEVRDGKIVNFVQKLHKFQ